MISKKELNKTSDTPEVVIVEGLNSLQNEELRNMADLKIYSHTDEDIRLILKIIRSPYWKKMIGEKPRDPRNFGGTKTPFRFAFDSWWKGTKKSEKKYIIPTQKYADLLVTYNETEDLPKNTELLTAFIKLYHQDPHKYQQKLKSLKEKGQNREAERIFAEELADPRAQQKVNSLVDTIKQVVQAKGKSKIKLIVDWDDCLQPVKPMAIYQEANPQLSITFKEFFTNFWEGTTTNTGTLWTQNEVTEYEGTEEEKYAVEEFEKRRQERKANPKLYVGSFYTSPERFAAPLTSFADDLLQALKEDLISELVIVTSFRKTENDPELEAFLKKEVEMKKEKIMKTFGQFPQFKLEYREIAQVMGRNKPHRWEIIQDNHPDFDLYVNDNPNQIISAWERFGGDKYYAVNDYLNSRFLQTPHVYHVKTTLSDITDEEIIKAAQEYRTKHGYAPWREENKDKTERERERERTKVYWIIGSVLLIVLFGVLLILFRKKKKFSRTKKW